MGLNLAIRLDPLIKKNLSPSAYHRTNLERQVLRKRGFRIFPAVRFKPGTAGLEARTLPLWYAVTFDKSL